MIGMFDDEVHVAGKVARIAREYRYQIEGSTIVRGQLSTPAIRFVIAVPVRMNNPDPRASDWISAGVQHPCADEQRLAHVTLLPQRRVAHPCREIVGATAHLRGRFPLIAGVRQGFESQEQDSGQEKCDNSPRAEHGLWSGCHGLRREDIKPGSIEGGTLIHIRPVTADHCRSAICPLPTLAAMC